MLLINKMADSHFEWLDYSIFYVVVGAYVLQ